MGDVLMGALLERRLNPDGRFRLTPERETAHRRTLSRLVQDVRPAEKRTKGELYRAVALAQAVAMDLFMEIEALQAELARGDR